MLRLRAPLALALVFALSSAALAAGTAATAPPKPTINGKYHDAIPPIAQAGKAQLARQRHPIIEKYRQKYVAKAKAGTLDVVEPEDPEIVRQQGKLTAYLTERAKRTNRPVLLVLEGFDGAGKSSTIRRLQAAVDAANVEFLTQHFGAPSAKERRWWPRTYIDKIPNAGQFKVFDRSWYGRAVYDKYFGMIGKAAVGSRLRTIRKLEASLGQDVDLVKIFLDASPERLAQTIGKREVEKPEILSSSDYVTFDDQAKIRGLFDRARSETKGWSSVSMDDRAKGRADVIRTVRKQLQRLDAERGE